MKKLFALMLVVAVPALADPPADSPLADLPGQSVYLEADQRAPFPGQLLSDAENLRRGQNEARCVATLQDAEQNGVLLPKPAVAALITGAAAAIVTSLVLGGLAAAHKL